MSYRVESPTEMETSFAEAVRTGITMDATRSGLSGSVPPSRPGFPRQRRALDRMITKPNTYHGLANLVSIYRLA